MTTQQKLEKFEKIGNNAEELIELSHGFLSIKSTLELTTGPNFGMLVDAQLLQCVGVVSDILKEIARKE